MKSLKFAFIFSFILLSSLVKAENQVFFSPKGTCEKMIVDRINLAEKTIDAAEMIVAHELFAEFLEEPYTDEDELDMWKYVLNRLES